MRKRRRMSIGTFAADNQLLLLFLSLLLIGTACGSALFGSLDENSGKMLSLAIGAVKPTLEQMAVAWLRSMVMPAVLLAVLFLSGLTAFGVPITVTVPLFFGLGIGMTQAYYYAQGIGGMGLSCLLVLPRFTIASIGLLMACAECFRMSVRFSRILLPGGVIGSLWLPFRLYLVRFIVCVGIAAFSAAVDVALRTVCAGWL